MRSGLLSMRNIIAKGAATVLVAALYACGSGGGSSTPADSLLTPTTFIDSLSVSFGDQWGAQQAQSFALLDDNKRAELNIDEFLAGLRSAMMIDQSTPGVAEGVSMGADIASQLDSYSAVGIYINRGKVLDAIESVLTTDTLPSETVAEYQTRLDEQMSAAQNLILERMRQERREQFLVEQKMQRENTAAADAMIAKLKAENPNVRESDSGLVYLIAAPGQGQRAAKGSTVSVVYEIKGLDGRLIDSSRGEEVEIPFDDDLIPGLQEGFSMLAPGAEATFYIPYRLGFGRDYKGVNPGEMIVVQVKLNGAK